MFLFPVGEEITKSCPHLVLIPLYLSIWHKKSFRNKLIVSIESNVLLSVAVNFLFIRISCETIIFWPVSNQTVLNVEVFEQFFHGDLAI